MARPQDATAKAAVLPQDNGAGAAAVQGSVASPSQLLEIAWTAASAFPARPHLRRRVRGQMQVIDAMFALGLVDEALAKGRAIAGLRLGDVYADYVYFRTTKGGAGAERAEFEKMLDRAKAIVRSESGRPEVQEWQCHLTLLKVARAWRALGDAATADKLAAEVPATSGTAVDPEWDRVATDPYRHADRARAEDMLRVFDGDYASLSLGAQQTTLEGFLVLHDRFFGDAALRQRIEDVLGRNAHGALPSQQFQVLVRLAETQHAHGDKAAVVRTAELMRKHYDIMRMRPEEQVRYLAQIARARAIGGEVQWARQDAERAMAIFQEGRESISNYERAEALRPLAFAWLAIGEKDQADDLLQTAIAESAENPNARPRCEDLVKTCIELAVRRVEPSARLVSLLHATCAGLKDPW
jgi:tetratricopeptide (TPR) repeat protein